MTESERVELELERLKDQVAVLIRERDEARAERDKATSSMWAAVNMRLSENGKARVKAIEEAAAVCDLCPDSHWGPWIKKHVLALKDKPNDRD